VAVNAAKIATAPRVAYIGEAFRHMAASWDDPLSGDGARIHGGRFNPPNSFPVLYLCSTRACAVAELRNRGEQLAIGVEGLLPRALYRYEVSLERVLDLTSARTRDQVGVSMLQIVGKDLTIPRQLGEAAHAAGSQAIRSPSATGVDDVLAVFPELLGSGRLAPRQIELWTVLSDLS
jgi:RES domain-containing protein